MFRSLDGLLERDAGVSLDDVLAARVTLPRARYIDDDGVRFFLETSERLSALPGVRSAAAAFVVPLGSGGLYRAHLPEGAPEPPEGPEHIARWNVVTPGYFSTVGIPVLAGRGFNDMDREETELAVVVSDSLARKMFPGEDPVGKRLRSWRDENVLRTVVGVVGDVRMRGMDTDYEDMVYVSALQSDVSLQGFVVRAEEDPMKLAGAVRDTIWSEDPDLPVTEMGTLRDLADGSVSELASFGRLMGIFAALALALASIGLYGVVSWSVAQRGREYGIRQALGASPLDIVRAVVRGALGLVGTGLAIGLALSFGLTRVMNSLLLGVAGTDLLTYTIAVGVIVGVAVAASVVPALRATRADPVESLRSE
jgi:predicted permease